MNATLVTGIAELVTHHSELGLLTDAAEARVAAAAGLILTPTSAAPLRVSVLTLVSHAYANRDAGDPPLSLVEPWLAPYRKARL